MAGTGFSEANAAGPSEYSVNAAFLWERGEKRKSRIEFAGQERRITEYELQDLARRLAFDVRITFVNLMLAQENVALARENLSAMTRILEVNQARVNTGDLAEVELMRTKVAVAQLEDELTQAELSLSNVRSRLHLLVGRPAGSNPINAAGEFERDERPVDASEIARSAFKERPDLMAAAAREARAAADVRLQMALAHSDIELGSEFRRQQGVNGEGNSLGLFLRIPLRLFDRNQGEITRARAESHKTSLGTAALRAEVASEVNEALVQYSAAFERLRRVEVGMLAQARQVQDWIIAPRLLQVPGVGDVFAFGGLVKQYQIEIDPHALYRYGLTIRGIAETIGANNQNAGGALVSNGQQAMVVRGVGLIRSTADLERVIVASDSGVPVYVRDVGSVRIGAAPRTGIFGLNERTGLVEGVVAMRRGDNPSEVLRGVKDAVDELNATLPEGVRIVPIYDRTELVAQTLRTVTRTLAEGLVVVAGVLLLLLCSPRVAFLAAATIPLSLLFAFLCMHLTGIPANLLSLGALDLGIIIDGTLVMVIHIARSLPARRESDQPWHEVVRDTAAAMEKPVFVAMVMIITAYVPLFALERVERRLFTPMAYTICYALLGSLLLTMTFIPALASYVFARWTGFRPNPILAWLQARYEPLIRVTVRRAWWVVASTALLAIGTLVAGRHLGTEFLPQLDEGVIWIRATLPPGIAIEQSAEVAGRIRELIRRHPEVELVSSQTGRQDSNTEPFGPNRNEFLVALRPYGSCANPRPKAELVEELAAELRTNIPGVAFSFTQPIIDMVTEAVTGSSADLAIIFTGPDLRELRRLAARALELVPQIQGAADSAIEQDADQSQLRILVDRQAVARYGINVANVQDVVELAIGGRAVSTMFEGDRRFDIAVRYEPGARGTVDSIRNLIVTTPAGLRIPLSELAQISVDAGASIISRRENRRQISVRTNIRGRDQGGFAADAQRRITAAFSLPADYHIEWGGQFENLARASRRLRIILPLTILLMFGLLYAAFESTVDACLVLLNVPFAMVGGVAALLLRGIPLSVSAAVGFVSVFGVAVMTGVLFIAEVNRRREAAGVPIEEAIVGAASARMVSNLMLILVAMLGMIPAATARGIGSDIQRPMATVIVGGLISTLVLALVAMPGLYFLASRRRRPSKPLLLGH